MDFRTATDRITNCVTLARVSQELGVAENTVARARMDPASPNARNAPEGWEAALATLARARAAELVKLAEELEGGG